MTEIFNKISETQKRKILRNSSSRSENLLWSKLRHSKLGGHKFRRQCSIDRFVVDFYCPKRRLAIEVDGDPHLNSVQLNMTELGKISLSHWGYKFCVSETKKFIKRQMKY